MCGLHTSFKPMPKKEMQMLIEQIAPYARSLMYYKP